MPVDLKSLTDQTEQLLHIFNAFKSVLLTEADILKSNQLNQLPTILEKKAHLSAEVETSHALLSNTLNTSQQPVDEIINSSLFQTFPLSLQNKLKQLVDIINECHDINLSNGMTVQILSNFNQVSLNILTGQEATPSMYESTGTQNIPQNKNSLGKA